MSYNAAKVALRKESVDRNCRVRLCPICQWRSLSARRAWIEMRRAAIVLHQPRLSLSARRAWIEIEFKASSLCSAAVALRKESVDRNGIASVACITVICVALRKESVDRNISQPMRGKTDEGRSPQGEHGMFLFLTVQGGFVHADIRFNFKNCYSKKLSHKII